MSCRKEKEKHAALINFSVIHNTLGKGWVIVLLYLKRAVLYYISIYISTVLILVETQHLPYHQLGPGPWVLCGQSSGLCVWSGPDWSLPKNTSERETWMREFTITTINYCRADVCHIAYLQQLLLGTLNKICFDICYYKPFFRPFFPIMFSIFSLQRATQVEINV